MAMAVILHILLASHIWTSVYGASSCPYPEYCSCTDNDNGIDIKCQLESFTGDILDLADTGISNMPVLRSDTVKKLRMEDNPLGELPVTALQHLPQLEECSFINTSLTTIYPGTFTGLHRLHNVLLDNNAITHLAAGTFMGLHELHSVWLSNNTITYLAANTLKMRKGFGVFSVSGVELSNNNLATIEYNAIQGTGSYLWLHNNALTTIDEVVFKPLLEGFDKVYLSGNPLTCGCDVLWLISNQKYMGHLDLDTPKCSNGTLLKDLNPAAYNIQCTD